MPFGVNKDHSLLPEVGHAIEGWLLVEDIMLCVHYNGAVYKVFNPVRSTSLVQRQVPVSPAHHIMIQVLPRRKHPQLCV